MPRPTVLTDEVVRKLLEAFKMDVSVEEACLYAGIAKDTYYRKLREDEGFSDEVGRARMYATMMARLSVIKAIPGDPHLALRYLERKRREEFSPQQATPPQREPEIDLGAEASARCPDFEARLAKYRVDPADRPEAKVSVTLS